MNLFISRVKNVFPTAKHMLKSETVCLRFSSVFQRTSCTNNYLLLNVFFRNEKSDSFYRKSYHSENVPKYFGKIVELDENLNEVVRNSEKIDTENESKRIPNESSMYYKTEEEIKSGDEIKHGEEIKGEEEKHKKSRISFSARSYRCMDKNSRLLSSVMSSLNVKNREKKSKFILEGKRTIREALIAGLVPEKLFFTRTTDLEDLDLPQNVMTYRIPYKVCELWGDTITHQGLIGIFKIPHQKTVKANSDCIPLTVICDNVRDPTNLGSIIRVVAGAGCEKLMLTTGCANPWEQKVIRSSAGAHFHLQILNRLTWTDIESNISETSQVFVADSNVELDSARDNSIFRNVNKNYEHLPTTNYNSVKFQKKETVFIIGGETLGLSNEAYKFTAKRNGSKLFIPTSKIDSLNVGVTLGILAFDFRRQLNSISEEDSNLSATLC